MSTANWAGLQSDYSSDFVTLSTPAKVLSIISGPVGSHYTSGISTTAASLRFASDDLLTVSSVTSLAATAGDFTVAFAPKRTGDDGSEQDPKFWIKVLVYPSHSYTDNGTDYIWDIMQRTAPRASMDSAGRWEFRDGGASVRIVMEPRNYDDSTYLELGYGGATRGYLLIDAEKAASASNNNTGKSDRPGLLVLESVSGVRVHVWASSSDGVMALRASLTDPQDDDLHPDSKVLMTF